MIIKRVAIVGAECTGKTTLARALAKHYKTVWVPECAREFVDKKKSLPAAADVAKIARLQKEMEAALIAQANRVLFCDTNLMMTVLYSEYYFGECPQTVRQAAEQEAYDLTLFAQDDIPWAPDPMQRTRPEARKKVQELIGKELDRRKIKHIPIVGTLEERLALSVRAVDQLLNAGGSK